MDSHRFEKEIAVDKSRTERILALRRRFPQMLLKQFLEIIEIVGLDHPDYLIEELEKAEIMARAEEARRQAELDLVLTRIRASEMHHRLRITAPADVELEYAQAILMYGFIVPGRQIVYAESRRISLEPIRMRVENKLFGFNAEKFNAAFASLVTHRVLLPTQESKEASYSLNLKARGTTCYGQQVIAEVARFIREEKR